MTSLFNFLTGISRKSQNSKLNYIMKSQRHHYSRFVDTSVWSYFGLNRVCLSFLHAASENTTRGVKTVDRVRLQSTFIRAHKIYLCQSVAFLSPLINLFCFVFFPLKVLCSVVIASELAVLFPML